MEKIVVIGKGGHARSIVDTIERQGIYDVAGYVVNTEEYNQIDEYPIIGKDCDLNRIFEQGIRYAVLGIGFLGNGRIRENLYEILKKIGYELPTVIDPSAIISHKNRIGEGSFIGKGVVINANAKIGAGCIINTGAIIEHDCTVGDFSHIAVGSVLCGNVSVGCRTLVGANATVIQERTIGDNCIVGAGEVVRKNIEKNVIQQYNCFIKR